MEWWRAWLGVPDDWYVEHRAYPVSEDRWALDVTVADGSVLECVALLPAAVNLFAGDSPRKGSQRGGAVPVVVAPMYSTGMLLGEDPRGRTPEEAERRALVKHLAQRGMAAVAVPWWFESIVDPQGTGLATRYAPAVAEHRRRHNFTGLGRAVADLIAVLGVLDSLPGVDTGRIGCIGHSLGGKLALHLAALDDRVKATVASEPGLGFAHSNWADPWYLDGRIPSDRDQDDLISLIAPRPLLLIAGGDSDGDQNAHLVASARARSGATIESLQHGNGHPPDWWALDAAYAWLGQRLS